MKPRLLAVVFPMALAAILAGPAAAEDLMQIYREAQQNDPALAGARSNWAATQERVPQARAALLPNVGFSGTANANDSNPGGPAPGVRRGWRLPSTAIR